MLAFRSQHPMGRAYSLDLLERMVRTGGSGKLPRSGGTLSVWPLWGSDPSVNAHRRCPADRRPPALGAMFRMDCTPASRTAPTSPGGLRSGNV